MAAGADEVLVHNTCGELVDLASPARRKHILDGDATGGGHRAGTGRPGKSECPASWSDDKIMHYVSDIATDPLSRKTMQGNDVVMVGIREGVEIRVVVRNGQIWTAYPINQPRNP